MSSQPTPPRTSWVTTLAVLGAFLIVAALVGAMRHYTQPPPIDGKRAAERSKDLAEMRAANAQALNTTAWIDKSKGLVRLRIQDAMKIVEREWGSDPAAARSNLIARVEKATAPPPKPKAAPNPFE